MFEDEEVYRIARFASGSDAENAQRFLQDAGIESAIIPEDDDLPPEMRFAGPAWLVCRATDRIQAIATLERARVF